ncbi:hypothetical protein [Draconibacterium sediminis]|uniref:Uncharacterized protein n=1 Tax=Draconibacterium sediminis TaxID=1544798 RepID=A0A0D8J884_9BACT|nr:hypothetical protein [Draconibacterium sediminis]KJF43092.1 hypothetical protein LH29_17080 [Draconibacterium sediminis]
MIKLKKRELNKAPEVQEPQKTELTESELLVIATKILPNLLFTPAFQKSSLLGQLKKHSIEDQELVFELLREMEVIIPYRSVDAFGNKNTTSFKSGKEAFKLVKKSQTIEQTKTTKEIFKAIYKTFLRNGNAIIITPDTLAEALIVAGYKVDNYSDVKKVAIALTVNRMVSRSLIRSEHGYILEIHENGLTYLQNVLDKSERVKNLPDNFKYTDEEKARILQPNSHGIASRVEKKVINL